MSQTDIRVGDDLRISCEDPEKEVRDRFLDVKAEVRRNRDDEVLNRDVLSVLLDLYWLHQEDGVTPP